MKYDVGVLLLLAAFGVLCIIGPVAADNNTPQEMPDATGIQPYTGPMGPDSSLYGLKLAFENLDESFTVNQTERLEKEINHSDMRIAELEGALATNQTDAADRALDRYWEKLNQTEETLAQLNAIPVSPDQGSGNRSAVGGDRNMTAAGSAGRYTSTGGISPGTDSLATARQMILRHQAVLESLLVLHPGDPGLARAYNTSLDLEQKFDNRVQVSNVAIREEGNHSAYRAQPITTPVETRSYSGRSWNETRENPGSGQFQGPANQTWQEQHGGGVSITPGQSPANGQGNGDANPGNGNGSVNPARNTNGNSDRDPRFHAP